MNELLRFTATGTNGVNLFLPPKFEFVFYNDKFEMYKSGKLVRTVNYSDIKEVSVIKTWQNNVFINCTPIGVNIYKISDELCEKIKEITSKDLKVSVIFKDKPEQMGLRGDYYFWDYLKSVFDNYSFPFTYEELEKIIKEEHLKITGVELTKDSRGYSEKFDNGGMSAGTICGEYWITKGLSILKERLNKHENK